MLRQLTEASSLRHMTREGISPRERMRAGVAGEEKVAKSVALCVNRQLLQMRKSQKAWPCARIGVSGAKASLSAASGRSGLGAGSAPGPLARQRRGFARFALRGRRSILVRSGADFVAGAALSQGQLFSRFELAWQAQHFRNVRRRFRGRRSTFARPSIDFVAGAALSQGQVSNSWQAQHFHKVKYRFRGRRSTLARSGTDFVAGAALSQGQVQISWQAQH